MNQPKILVVDDDKEIVGAIKKRLTDIIIVMLDLLGQNIGKTKEF